MENQTNTTGEKSDLLISPEEFERKGFCISHDFLTEVECERLLSLVENYRQTHDVPRIQRQSRAQIQTAVFENCGTDTSNAAETGSRCAAIALLVTPPSRQNAF